MYVSVRDAVVLWAYPTIEAGLRALGLSAVELHFHRDRKVLLPAPKDGETHALVSDPAQAEALRVELQASGISASALLMATDFSNDDRDGEVQWVTDAVRAADMLGASAIRIDARMRAESEWPLDRRIEVFAECMKRVLDLTADSSVEMGIENHGIQGNTPEFLDRVLDSVGSDRVGLTMDTGNFYWAGHPLDRVYEILEHFAPRTKHTHCKNIGFPEEKRNVRRDPGWGYSEYVCAIREGDIDHSRLAAMLRKAGYKGDLCIEDESLPSLPPDQMRARMLDDARFLAEVLQRA